MKIALAVFQLETRGGKERDCLAIAEFLAQRGHDVSIVTTSSPDGLKISSKLIMLPRRGMSNHDRARNFAESVAAYRKTARPDALLSFERIPGADFFFAADAAMGLRLKGLSAWLPRGRTYLGLERELFSRAGTTHLFFLTERQCDEYASLYQFDSTRATVLPVILHEERYAAAISLTDRHAMRTGLGLPDDAIVAMSVAVKPIQKGVDRAMDAIGKFPELHLVSIGSSDRRLADQARALGIEDRIHVVPYASNVMELLGAADFLIHPARAEAAGQVIAESLLAKCPAIVSGLCGYAREVARYDAGIVLPEPFRQQNLVDAVARILADLRSFKKAAASASAQLFLQRSQWLETIATTIESRGITAG